jgi:alpha-amylase
MGNDIQRAALFAVYGLERDVLKTRDRHIIEDWRKLQTSDHFYYMCTKWFADGDVHKYFSPYDTPYTAHIAFMNALGDLQLRVQDVLGKGIISRSVNALRSWFPERSFISS